MSRSPPRASPRPLAETLSAFADRLFRTGGRDPGDEALPLPPERLELYRGLVAGGYRSMLTFAHTATLRLLEREGLRREDVVRKFLETSPSSSHSTREIADRFGAFLPAAYPEVSARRPDLGDLIRVERAELRATYHADDPGEGATPDDVTRLRASSVEEFLGTAVLRAPSGSVVRTEHRVTPLRAALLARSDLPPPSRTGEVVVVGREPVSLEAAVATAEDPGASALERIAEGESLRLEVLAGRWIEALDADDRARGEPALLAAFAGSVLAGLAAGFLRLAPPG